MARPSGVLTQADTKITSGRLTGGPRSTLGRSCRRRDRAPMMEAGHHPRRKVPSPMRACSPE